MIEIVILFLIKWFLIIIVYLSVIIVNVLYMFMYLFNYIVLIIVMVMSCNIVGDITRIEFLFSMVIVSSNIYKLLFLVILYVTLVLMVLCLLINTSLLEL